MGKISRTRVTLSIWGKDIRPDEITRALQCEPTRVARTGESITLSSGATRVVRRGYWMLESDEADTGEIHQRVRTLLGHLNPDEKVWHTLAKDHDVKLFCGLFLESWNEGFALPSELLAELGQRGIRLDFDIYSPVDSWPDSGSGDGDEQV